MLKKKNVWPLQEVHSTKSKHENRKPEKAIYKSLIGLDDLLGPFQSVVMLKKTPIPSCVASIVAHCPKPNNGN